MKIQKIIIGTAQFEKGYGNLFNEKNLKNHSYRIKKLIKYANNLKLNYFDSAISYKNKKNFFYLLNNNTKIITKLPNIPNSNIDIKKWMVKIIEKELKIIRKKNFWGIMFHNSEFLKNSNRLKVISAINYLKEKKYCKNVGISVYEKNEILKHLKFWKPDIIQFPYSIFDQRIDDNFFKTLKKKKIILHARSIFLQGLTINNKYPNYFKAYKKSFLKWHKWCHENNLSKLSASLNFVFSNPYIDKVVIGLESDYQLREIININKKREKLIFPNLNLKSKKILNPSLWKI